MSLLFADSFDGVIAAGNKWDMLNGTIHTDYGRHGTKGLGSPGTGVFLRKLFNAATSRVVVGGWSYIADVTGSSNMYIFQLESPDSSIQLRYRVGETRFTISGTGIASQAIGGMGSGQPLTWHFVELMWEPGVAAEVRVNGQQLWTGTPGGSGTPFRLESSQGSGSGARPQQQFDDIYLLDSSGSANNGFLGPIKIASLKPDGAGNRTELTATPAGNNWERVSDGSDATYVEGDPGDGDLYTFEDLSSPDDVIGVVQYWRAFDSAGGAITGRAIARVGGTEYDGDDKTMPGSEATHIQPWDVNPDTGQPWTPAEVDGAEFGVEFA